TSCSRRNLEEDVGGRDKPGLGASVVYLGRKERAMRSMLFVPADSERKLARGLESGADALILDLEDSVAASNHPTARKLAREFLEAHGPDRIPRYARINRVASGLALDALAATVAGRPDGILLPNCLPEDVRTVAHYLSA